MIFFLIILLFSINLHATTYYVSPYGNDASTGTQDDPFQTIAAATQHSTSGDIILLMPGGYSGSKNQISLKNITIGSTDGADSTILSCASDTKYFFTLDYSVTIFGLSFISCETAIEASYGHQISVTVLNSKFFNIGDVGIRCRGNLNVTNCEFQGSGSGISCYGYGSIIQNSTFINLYEGLYLGTKSNLSNLHITDCLYGIQVAGKTDVSLSNSRVESSFIANEGFLTIKNSHLSSNGYRGYEGSYGSLNIVNVESHGYKFFIHEGSSLNGENLKITKAGISINNGSLSLRNSFIQSSSKTAINVIDSTINLWNVQISQTQGATLGGGFFISGGLFYGSNVTIQQNKAINGSAFYCNSTSKIVLEKSLITHNNASKGNVFDCDSSLKCIITLLDTEILENFPESKKPSSCVSLLKEEKNAKVSDEKKIANADSPIKQEKVMNTEPRKETIPSPIIIKEQKLIHAAI